MKIVSLKEPLTTPRWHVADWSMSQPMIPNDTSGVYAIYCEGELSYIGSSDDMRTRIRLGHKIYRDEYGRCDTPWGHADQVTVKYRPCKRVGEWLSREYRLIERLGPALNERASKSAKLKAKKRIDNFVLAARPRYAGGVGASIPGSNLVRSFCASCAEPIRVSKAISDTGLMIRHYCADCGGEHGHAAKLTPRQGTKKH